VWIKGDWISHKIESGNPLKTLQLTHKRMTTNHQIDGKPVSRVTYCDHNNVWMKRYYVDNGSNREYVYVSEWERLAIPPYERHCQNPGSSCIGIVDYDKDGNGTCRYCNSKVHYKH